MNTIKRSIFIITFFFIQSLALSAPAKSGEVNAECHDGTKISLKLNTDTCLSQLGTNYLIQKVMNFCSQHCSPISGKCRVANMNGSYGECPETGPERLFQGFTVACFDGFQVDFNSCSSPEKLRAAAERICLGKNDSESGASGIKSFNLHAPCN